MSRRQLEFEARQIRSAMEEQLGSCQEMERRAQARVSRIQQIEKDILRLGAHLQVEDAQGPSDSSGLAGAQSSNSRLDHEPVNEASYSVPRRITSHLGTKVEMVYSLLSMLGTHDKDDMSRTLLAMSSSQDSCIAMRQSGCLPLLIQLLHGNDKDSLLLGNSRGSKEARARASAALHNIVHSQPDDKRGRREIRVLHLLEQVRHYCEECWSWQENHERGVDQEDNPMPSPVEHQICPAVCVLMKLSFDEEHRHAMNELGGLQAVAELLQVDCEMFGLSSDHYSVTLRRYAGMALTNLTFGDVANKATLCSMKGCMRAMVAQLKSESEDLQQVIASVLRNLSWRADVNSKKTLREVGSVRALMGCALEVQKESTLKSVLSALWNLSAHCTENKADICAVDGALAFLVGTLTHRSHTNTLAIIESGGGILRNVSSLIATNEAHRQILREHSCLPTLLQHLKSHSLTIVSNACGTLWNLSARDAKDQEALWELGAMGMLRNLIHSRHKMIAMGSAAALRNLMANRPARYKDASVVSPGAGAPSLHARKQKALIEELDAQQLSETFDNIDNLSPKAAHRKGRGCNGGGGGSTTRSYANTPVLSSPKNGDGSKRTSEEMVYTQTVFSPSVRASSDSLNSVTSADGYGNRGKTKPSSSEPFYSSDENGANRCCVYRKYPADLAHKIRSANHMADDDGAELDTPINYSLKYSDEQLNSGRQSPSHRGMESDDDNEQGARLRVRKDGSDSATSMTSVPPSHYVVVTGTSNYGGDSTSEQPIDYSLKYGGDAPRKPLFKPEESAAPSLAPPPSSSTSKPRPLPPPANRLVPKGNQEMTQTYCVEDTPICFSRGSSLSSLSSEDEEEDGDVIGRKGRGGSVISSGGNDYPTLPVSEKDAHKQQRQQKEAESQTATAAATIPSTRGRRGHHHHHSHAHHHHHHQVTSSSGARTPKSPPEQPYAQETPLMFSRCTSVSSLDSFSTSSIASSVRSSEPCSGMPSGVVSPSDLPDSPGQTMPPSRAKTPPLPPPMQKTEEEEKAKKKDEEESSVDVLLHFATESTPHGFSRASSLSALSLDEPYIAAEMLKKEEEEEEGESEERKDKKQAKQILDESDDDDDIEILEACINMAMPKSSRKPKKQQQAAPRKPSQLPVYKLFPPQSRSQSQQRKDVPPPEEIPRVYCVEGTPLNFSTATSLSDLTIDSPPNEEVVAAVIPVATATSSQRRRAGLPEGENGDDILTECISAAMPKAKPRKHIRAASNGEHLQAPPIPPPLPAPVLPPLGPQQKKKPTSPVKPMPQRAAYSIATAAKAKPGFAFDSPRHYTPIEGTPCCFSRNDSLSSLDFDEDDGGAEKDEEEKKTKEEEGRKRKQQTAAVFPRPKPATNPPAPDEKQKFAIEDTPVCFSRNSSLSSLSDIDQENNNKEFAPPEPPEKQDKGKATTKSPPPPPLLQAESKSHPPAASGYAPKAFHVEDTPVCFSRNSSLSSLSIDSEDDLLQECISSAMPKKKKKAAAATIPAAIATPLLVPKTDESILAEEEPSEAPRSPASPDSESFDWKAIQEGANSIVSSLNAAAAASSLSRQPSSDSDSVLSLKSVGSPFRLPVPNHNAEEEELEEKEEVPMKRGARILKPGERSTLEAKKEEEEEEAAKALRGGKKVYKSLITGKPRVEPAARGRSKPRVTAMAKAPGSGDGADRGGGSSRDSTPSRPSTATNQKGGKLSQLPRTASPGSASSSSSASRPAKQSGAARSGGGIPRSESASRVSNSSVAKKQKAEPEKPTLVRQSTFIKEAPSPTLKRKLEESAALESPSSPDMPLTATPRRHDVNRSHSESPSRPQEATSSRFSRTGTWKRENGSSGGGGNGGKHSTSLPRVGTWKRTGSSSSVLSASSESSEKGRSEEESTVRSKGTWRKGKSGGDSSAGRSGGNKLEDVWVRLEDCPVNNPRSSSSCSARSPTTANAPPIIDSPTPSKIPSSSSSSSSNLNLRRSCESLDDKPPLELERQQQQQHQQRSQQRSCTVAARVSPFNYTPSPRKSSADVTTTATPTTTTTTSSSTTPTRPSLIPTPVTKKREPKGGEGVGGGGGSGGERGSYIVTSV
ncbi:hypothetical protein PAMP_012844 [Pampus punctatissimus]